MPSVTTYAFDVYGTLIDPLGITDALESCIGDSARDVAVTWRSKQIEYLFRRAPMRREELAELLEHADLAALLDGVVSVHDTQSFKPDPQVYEYFLETTDSVAEATWLVSGNPFDVLGADACGWNTAWVRRDSTAVFDPWGPEPTVVVSDLGELPTLA